MDPAEVLVEELASALGFDEGWELHRPRLANFLRLVWEWNQRFNLAGAQDMRSLAEVLLADAMVLARAGLVHRGERIIDVGSGAGSPALPLALIREDLQFLLVEARQKRVAFLRWSIATLGLTERVRVIQAHISPSRPRMPPCSYSPSLASSRATFEPATWLKVAASLAPAALAFVVPGTLLETNHLKARLTYRLPWSLAPREILRFEKP